ncbi:MULTISPECIES: hypothetical protein [unclassified Micromonospora]|uniref:hypothetical protein n=1 Tax=unclassified Micromonospora TaxID=2617518 RepID=UPI00364327B6
MRIALLRRSRRVRRSVGLLTLGAVAFSLAGCGSEPTDFDTSIERHRCEKLVRGGDGDIDLSCVDPDTGQRVDIEFEANDRQGQYFTDTRFGGSVHVFSHDEVRGSEIYPKIKKG